MHLSDAANIALICSASIAVIAAFLGLLRWGHHQFKEAVEERLEPIRAELQHNTGSSLKDHVSSLRTWSVRIEEHLSAQDRRLEDFVHRFERIEDSLDKIRDAKP
jgi:hypothetical protein